MAVFLIGDRNENKAVVEDADDQFMSLTIGDPNYYTLNADWSHLPEVFDVSTNADLLRDILSKIEGSDEIHYLSVNDGSRWKTYSKWVSRRGGESIAAYCVGTIFRTKYGNGAEPVEHWESVLSESSVEIGDGDVLVLFNVDNKATYGKPSDAINRLLSGCDRIVVRSSVKLLVDGGSFLGWVRGNESLAKKTTLVISAESMRRNGCNIRRAISWEQLVEETTSSLRGIDGIDELEKVIVTYGCEGCLVFEPHGYKHRLVYLPNELECQGEGVKGHVAFGTKAIMVAAVTHAAAHLDSKSVVDALKGGIAASQLSFNEGLKGESESARLLMRLDETADAIKSGGAGSAISVYDVGIPEGGRHELSIIDSVTQERGMNQLDFARRYVRDGEEASRELGVPMLSVGKLVTFERGEIEGLNNLRTIMRRYVADASLRAPLSICVFGSPGSGKSFAVKQIAESVGVSKRSLEFNLSQMRGHEDLVKAFHRVASEGIRGVPPLVFFDEFDSANDGEKLGWLKYFLAPIHDGVYLDGESEYSLGKAILVFAGGTFSSHSDFERVTETDEGRAAKALDFASRVRAYVDITGLNGPKDGEIPYVRRAVLLRSMILGKMYPLLGTPEQGQTVMVHEKVLDAFLEAKQFKHDARSMGAIVDSSRIAPGGCFTPACIENNCLDLHVTKDFVRLLS